MMGVRTPENFDNQYFATNISDFWKRWHITFSTFLKIYVFKPVISLLNKLPIAKYRMVVSVMAYMVTFLVCGLWHGSTLNFALFIPTYHALECPEWEGQLYTIRHQELRDNNQLYIGFLLKSVKRNGGYLVLGTSETNARPKGNYYDFLNADTTSPPTLMSIPIRCGRIPNLHTVAMNFVR